MPRILRICVGVGTVAAEYVSTICRRRVAHGSRLARQSRRAGRNLVTPRAVPPRWTMRPPRKRDGDHRSHAQAMMPRGVAEIRSSMQEAPRVRNRRRDIAAQTRRYPLHDDQPDRRDDRNFAAGTLVLPWRSEAGETGAQRRVKPVAAMTNAPPAIAPQDTAGAAGITSTSTPVDDFCRGHRGFLLMPDEGEQNDDRYGTPKAKEECRVPCLFPPELSEPQRAIFASVPLAAHPLVTPFPASRAARSPAVAQPAAMPLIVKWCRDNILVGVPGGSACCSICM